jgi:hypothetical protein
VNLASYIELAGDGIWSHQFLYCTTVGFGRFNLGPCALKYNVLEQKFTCTKKKYSLVVESLSNHKKCLREKL